jgi:hypothetical protein
MRLGFLDLVISANAETPSPVYRGGLGWGQPASATQCDHSFSPRARSAPLVIWAKAETPSPVYRGMVGVGSTRLSHPTGITSPFLVIPANAGIHTHGCLDAKRFVRFQRPRHFLSLAREKVPKERGEKESTSMSTPAVRPVVHDSPPAQGIEVQKRRSEAKTKSGDQKLPIESFESKARSRASDHELWASERNSFPTEEKSSVSNTRHVQSTPRIAMTIQPRGQRYRPDVVLAVVPCAA